MATTVKWYGDEVRKNIEADAYAKLRMACELTLNAARRLMAEPKHGKPRPHKRTKAGRVSAKQWSTGDQKTTRSAPGEAPAAQHGGHGLQGALTVGGPGNITKRVKRNWWRVGTNVEYHKWLEKGTEDGRLAARPLMKPALERAWPKIKALFRAS